MKNIHVKVVDDEPAILQTLSEILADEGYIVSTAENGLKALDSLKNQVPDLIMLDIWMPEIDGMETLSRILKKHPSMLVIMMSGHGSIETAVRAIKQGAYDYIEKPLSLEKVCITIAHALREKKLVIENRVLKEKIQNRYKIIGESDSIKSLLGQIEMAGPSNGRVLISGENGTGKELVAMAVHACSNRADRPFIEVNCAAIPENLIESELLGHEKGAFTGADGTKTGKFEQANGGTIFLDEIGDMSLSTQAKVLRVLQEQRFCRVGGSRNIEVDVRVIAASNKNLTSEIKEGHFREDLFYRLNVIPLIVPPLRNRKDDIPLLVNYFLQNVCRDERLKPKTISNKACHLLSEYSWPGNVRELKNIVERLVIMTPGVEISGPDVNRVISPDSLDGKSGFDMSEYVGLKDAKDRFEKELISNVLIENDWNISKAAEILKMERTHLYKKIKSLDIIIRNNN